MALIAKKIVPGEETQHHVSERQKRARPKPPMQPPMTPMIDVTFQLLLFFVLTMEFRQREGQIPADLPQESGSGGAVAVELPEVKVILESGGAGRNAPPIIRIARHRTDSGMPIDNWDSLHAELEGLRQQFQSDETPVIIECRPGVRWGDAVDAYNQGKRAGYKVVGFAPVQRSAIGAS